MGKYLEKKLSLIKKITAGYKQTEIGVIPEDWDVKSFRDICWVNQGLQIAIKKRLKNPNSKSKIYITIQYLNDGKETEYIDEYSVAVCCGKDDILMTRTGNTGIVISGVDGVFHNNFFKINFDKKQIEKDYLFYYLKDSNTKRIILEKAGTSTIPDLNHNDFYSIQIPLPPSKTEQTAIATVLSDTDALIEKLEKLIAKKKAIKQGGMQQLLTGKKRLPGFSGEWETKKLGDIFRVTRGQVLAMTKTTRERIGEDQYPVYSSQTKDNGLAGYYKDYLFENCITWTTDGANAGEVKYRAGKFYCTNVCGVLENNVGYSNLCVAAVFNSISKKYVSYVGNPKLMNNVVSDIEVSIPRSIEEQIAIAIILSDMDSEIKKLEQKRNKYIMLKQGMMQQLLTGRIRIYANN